MSSYFNEQLVHAYQNDWKISVGFICWRRYKS
jgi:hypothetical protein